MIVALFAAALAGAPISAAAVEVSSTLAAAPAKKAPAWVALVHTRGDVPITWRDALRGAAEEAKERTWVSPPSVTLEELQLALGCASWSESCAGQIASMTGAANALVVNVVPKDDGAYLTVQPVKAGGGAVGAADSLELAGRGAEDLTMAEAFVRGVVKGQKPAFLRVETDMPNVEVILDGERVGEAPWRGAVQPGDHRLMLRVEGRAPLMRQFQLKPGDVHSEVHSMTAAGVPRDMQPTIGVETREVVTNAPAAPAPASGVPGSKIAGWSLASAGGLMMVGGAAALTTSVMEYYRREPCGAQAGGCVPRALMFGLYRGTDRLTFLQEHISAWVGGSIAALTVGGLLVGTGIALAVDEPNEIDDPTSPAGRPAADERRAPPQDGAADVGGPGSTEPQEPPQADP